MNFVLQPWYIVILALSRNFNDTGADDYLRGTGHFTTAVQDHPSPDFTARPSVTRADMTISASAQKEIAQDPMGRCVRTRVKSAEVASDGCYWAVNDFKEAW